MHKTIGAVAGVGLAGYLLYLGLKKTGTLDKIKASSYVAPLFNDKLGDGGAVNPVSGSGLPGQSEGKSTDWLGVGATIASGVLFGDIFNNDRAVKIADAIAFAEGYYSRGSRPSRNNNPGDLTKDITGKGVGYDGPFVVYASPEDGWRALIKQTNLMLSCQSDFYCGSDTISKVSTLYTDTDQASWAKNVAARLNVPVTTRLAEV